MCPYKTKNINTWYTCWLIVILIIFIFQYFLNQEQVIVAEGRRINTVEQGKESNVQIRFLFLKYVHNFSNVTLTDQEKLHYNYLCL